MPPCLNTHNASGVRWVGEVYRSLYNCLTASTLIGQLLDRHALPYDVQVRPDHVFLIVDPGHTNVVLEATDPQGGVYAPDVKAKRALIDRFRRYKLIDGRTTGDVDIDSLVYSDISADTVVTGNGLIGLHYWNSALDYAERNQFDTAIAQFAKSYWLHPKESTLVQLTTTMAASLRENDAEQLDHIERYLQMRLLLSSLYPSLQGTYPKEFYALTEKYLIGRSDSLYHQQAFPFFEAYAPDSASLEAVRFIHHFQMGRYLGLRKQFRGALDELMQARALRPKDLDVDRLLGDCLKGITGQFYGRPDYKEKVEQLLRDHPALMEIDEMRNVRAIGFMSFAFDHFNIDDRKAALKSLGQFETEFDPEHSPLTPEAIATVYFAAWRSYTRAQDHATARRMVEQGLRYAPFSEDLNRVKKYKP